VQFFGTFDPDEANSPPTPEPYLDYPAAVTGPVNTDSVQIVIEVLDQPERLLGVLPQQRVTARLPVIDEIQLIQLQVDDDYDGVPNPTDVCGETSAAGQDANGDGCIEATATMRHVESWAGNDSIRYTISTGGTHPFSAADLTAIRAGFNAWKGVTGASVPLVERPTTTQTDANMLDGVNRVTREDDYQFEPGVLAITPTTSFTREWAFRDATVLPGQIVDSDLIINPDTPYTNTNEAGAFDLQSVVTHEAGHLLGLGHSGVLDASMFFVIQPKQDARSLTDDDRAAVAAAYPSAQLATNFATIRGRVTNGKTLAALPGALVTAVRDSAGSVVDSTASDYTDENGNYALRRLPPGAYSVRITPLDGNVGGFPFRPGQRERARVPERRDQLHAGVVDEGRNQPGQPRAARHAAARRRRHPEPHQRHHDDRHDTAAHRGDIAGRSSGRCLGGDIAAHQLQWPGGCLHDQGCVPGAQETGCRLRSKAWASCSMGRTSCSRRAIRSTSSPTTRSRSVPALKDLSGLALADTFRAVFSTEDVPAVLIQNVTPLSVPAGGLITITGSGFYPSDSVLVSFDPCLECPVPVISITPTTIVLQAPGSPGTGRVRVETGRGFDMLDGFTVLPPVPQVSPTPDGDPVSLGSISPTDVALSPDGGLAFAAGDNGFATVAMGTLPRTAIPRLTTGRYRGLALTPDGARAVLGRASTGEVLVLGALDGPGLGIPVHPPIVVGGEPSGLAISPDGKRAYVTDRNAGIVHEVDIDPVSLTAYTLLRDITLSSATLSGGIAVSLDGGQLYLASSNQGLLRVPLSEEDPSAQVLNSSATDGGIAVTPAGDEVLAPGGLLSGDLVTAKVPFIGPAVAAHSIDRRRTARHCDHARGPIGAGGELAERPADGGRSRCGRDGHLSPPRVHDRHRRLTALGGAQ
jgi:hypothetical protein